MNIIFLDIDGVLNNGSTSLNPGDVLWDSSGWSTQNLLALDFIIQRLPDVKFVLSSTWRQLYTLKEIENMFIKRLGYSPTFVGITPIHLETDSGWATRGDEIQSFMDNTNIVVNRYVIIDDDIDMLEHQLPHFVQTSWDHGLTIAEAKTAVAILRP